MPRIVFDENEILARGEAIVNEAGLAYISRRLKGKKVRWAMLKDEGLGSDRRQSNDTQIKL